MGLSATGFTGREMYLDPLHYMIFLLEAQSEMYEYSAWNGLIF